MTNPAPFSMDDFSGLRDSIAELRARLDRYETRLGEVEDLLPVVARLEERLQRNTEATDRCTAAVANIDRKIEERDRLAGLERKELLKERRQGRQWLIGAVIASSSVLVGAAALAVAIFG